MMAGREAELLCQLMELSEGTVYWKDRQGRYQGGNLNQLKTTKFSSWEELIGKTDLELYPDHFENMHRIRAIDEYVMATPTPLVLEEVGVDCLGNEAVYLTKKQPLLDENGEVYGLVGTSTNITERKAAEQLKAMKTSFIQNMQHDIRTPFTGLCGLAQHLWEKEEDAGKKQYLGYIHQSSKELFDYCNKIMEFSQMQSTQWALESKEVDIRGLIQKVFSTEKPAALCKNLEFICTFGSNVPSTIFTDEHRWFSIVLNLLSNAIKFTETGKVELSLQMLNFDAVTLKAQMRLTVTDTGVGIPKEKRSLIYLPFSRLHPSNQNKYPGLGFGLSTVKQCLDELKGRLEVESIVNCGTSFKCTIPVKLPAAYGETTAWKAQG